MSESSTESTTTEGPDEATQPVSETAEQGTPETEREPEDAPEDDEGGEQSEEDGDGGEKPTWDTSTHGPLDDDDPRRDRYNVV